ncbi:hypothetical protein DNTS_031003 [Danionella cerebrum]|uniref:Pleckstrin n=1 Tax=Danionella cerebrum TaxID=2873325 RepID=A0A553PV98_9TELE|nr:hypothetical protein DNTS_031003 [Danionella translucida]
MEPSTIREGYLVKKGTVLNSWRVMWVVLADDAIEFYKKKSDGSPKGMIPLKGATLISPCQDFSKRMLVFKLRSLKNQDHFFQATHLEEREHWLKDIRRAISCLQAGKKFARNELYVLMKDQERGVKELKLEKDNRLFNHCFMGNTVVDWLISAAKARNRAEALMLATGLLNEGFLLPAGDVSKDGVEKAAECLFLDQTDAFYYFADSGFFSEGYSSSDEDVLTKEEFRGAIIKQGCLLKQSMNPNDLSTGSPEEKLEGPKVYSQRRPGVHSLLRPHQGKHQKQPLAFLCCFPLLIGEDDPLGSVPLRGSVVTALECNPDGRRQEVMGNLFEIITAEEIHYYLQAGTAEERSDWIRAVQSVAKTGN